MANEREQPSQAQSILQSIMDKRAEWAKDQPAFMGQLDAMRRDMLTDVRDQMNQFFFGQRDGPGQPGMPLNPTSQMVSQDLGQLGNFQAVIDCYSARTTEKDMGRERGMER